MSHLTRIIAATAIAAAAAGCASASDVRDPEPTVVGQAVAVDGVEARDVTATYDGFTWCIRFTTSPPACGHQIEDGNNQPGVKDRTRQGITEDGVTCASEATSAEVARLDLTLDDGDIVTLEPIAPSLDDETADFHVFAWCGAEETTFDLETSPVLAADS